MKGRHSALRTQHSALFLDACLRKRVPVTPVWFMRQAGRYMAAYRKLRERHTILELCERPELAAEVTLQPVRAIEVDAAILFADILLPARPMGVRLEFVKGEGPSLSPPMRTARDVERLRDFDPEEGLGFVLDAVRLIRRELGTLKRPVPLIGFAGAPFTLASYLIEGGPSDHYLATKAMMHGEPELWDRLMSKLAKMTARYLAAQAKAGAQALQLFDSWAGCLSKADYARFVLPYSKRIMTDLRAAGVPRIHFGTGTAPFLEDFASAGSDVVGVDWRIPLDAAWKRIGPRAIQGNLDPALLVSAPRSALKKEVRRILKEAGGRPGHIFNLGHGILPSTPVDNVRAVADWVHEYV
ncbi:MAG: uroporphyrinogen decarboxylase [Proteobacteria bacterium]|nr:uroporphyrinogen decarboxylase [Pseudomonadota bacterium]